MKLKFDRSYILIAAIVLCLIMAACSPSGTNNADALTGAFATTLRLYSSCAA